MNPPGPLWRPHEPPRAPSRRVPQGGGRVRAQARAAEAFDIAGAQCNVHVVQPALAVAHLAVAIPCDIASRWRVSSAGRVAAACWVPSAGAALITRCGTELDAAGTAGLDLSAIERDTCLELLYDLKVPPSDLVAGHLSTGRPSARTSGLPSSEHDCVPSGEGSAYHRLREHVRQREATGQGSEDDGKTSTDFLK